MKFYDTNQCKRIDEYTIQNEKITSLELMERAGNEVFLEINNRFKDLNQEFVVFCGVGNNGGDGLVISRLLYENRRKVKVYVVKISDNKSKDFVSNLERLNGLTIEINWITDINEFPDICNDAVIIDSIFGIGLKGNLEEFPLQIIEKINQNKCYKISVDLPSGMFMEKHTEVAVCSDLVLTFHVPKLALYLPNNYSFVKEIKIIPIGLDLSIISEELFYSLIDNAEIKKIFKPISDFAHKGNLGHSMIIGGSYGKIGAVCLSAKAALKSGCGLVSVYIPKCGYNVIQTAFPEAMVETDLNENIISQININCKPSSIGIGMGLGVEKETQNAFYQFIKEQKSAILIDADGINILSKNKDWLSLIPENSILTPHPKELKRLIGEWKDDFEKLEKVKSISKLYRVIIVIKGRYTTIVNNDYIFVNSTGNSGLATAGSGDVLSGIITGLLAQGYKSIDAAVLGVYIHGKAADIGTEIESKQSFIASNITDNLGSVFKEIEKYI